MKNLGEILKSQRKKRKLTYNQVYSRIKIQPCYIKALEQNDYDIFDGKIHAQGFLKIYADLLNLNVNQILALWRREYSYKFNDGMKVPEKNRPFRDLKANFIITPDKIFIGLGIVVLLAFFGYLFHSYKSYSGPPYLEIYSPENNKVVNSSLVDITGKTDIDSALFINGEKLLLKPDGTFAVLLNLKEGVNTLSITSINKLDKKAEEILTVIYRAHDVFDPTIQEATESTSIIQE